MSKLQEIKQAITAARQAAKAEAVKACGRAGVFMSRGAYLKGVNAKGDTVYGECESDPFDGSSKAFADLRNLVRYETKVAKWFIEGGYNWSSSIKAYCDSDYDPWVSEWSIEITSEMVE